MEYNIKDVIKACRKQADKYRSMLDTHYFILGCASNCAICEYSIEVGGKDIHNDSYKNCYACIFNVGTRDKYYCIIHNTYPHHVDEDCEPEDYDLATTKDNVKRRVKFYELLIYNLDIKAKYSDTITQEDISKLANNCDEEVYTTYT